MPSPRALTAPVSWRALALAGLVGSLLVAGIGLGSERARFGGSTDAAVRRLEREVRASVLAKAIQARTLAAAVTAEPAIILRATLEPDRLPDLFDRLVRLGGGRADADLAATVYVPAGPVPGFKVLAWTTGTSGRDLPPARLDGPAATLTLPAPIGLRVLSLVPVMQGDRRIAVAVAETHLTLTEAPLERATPGIAGVRPRTHLPTPFGPVRLRAAAPPLDGQDRAEPEALAPRDARTFLVSTAEGDPLVHVDFTSAQIGAARVAFRADIGAAALLPWVVVLVLGAVSAASRRRRPDPAWRRVGWTVAAAALVFSAAVAADAAAYLGGAPPGARACVWAVTAVAIVSLTLGRLWWDLRRTRSLPAAAFWAAQGLAGLVVAGAFELLARLVSRLGPVVLNAGTFTLFPLTPREWPAVSAVLLVALALIWTAGLTLAIATVRGRTTAVFRSAGRLALWVAPTVLSLLLPMSGLHRFGWSAVPLIVALVAFGLGSDTLRRRYRRASQSLRTLGAALIILVPLVALYPMTARDGEQALRRSIEHDYAPATARHPQDLRTQLAGTQTDIDRIETLPILVSGPPSDSQAAFQVWRQTRLPAARVVSDVELFNAAGVQVSRFALNLPAYAPAPGETGVRAVPCQWVVFGEALPFGAQSRLMLHAERGVCDDHGRAAGSIVVHVASADYQALPFISASNPYAELLPPGDAVAPPRAPAIELAVYGWGRQPIFASSGLAWSVDADTFDRLYLEGDPFWTAISSDTGLYRIHFSQSRSGIYAIGYRATAPIDHVMRATELAALGGVFFLVLQIGAALVAPVTRTRTAPVSRLFDEVRTSFYRKLFLLFVAAAVVPVVTFATIFGSYMEATFRADVESEAKGIVTVAQRVFEELSAADQDRVDALSDDVMVWTRQVIGQDVNLFQGADLAATSQRDLFDSGLFPTRTPATLYRRIALERAPTVVATDAIAGFPYLVAGAPVLSKGRDAILTVPQAPRQRELERKIDQFNRGVLVGVVLVVLLAAGIGASVASRVADPVARLTRATRQIAAGDFDVRIAADTADELRRLVDAFNGMAQTLVTQRAELARTNQLQAWHEMARQVAHEIKNPLTPIQLAAEHLRHVHADQGRPLGPVAEQCVETILGQVRLLRQIASEFSNFARQPTARLQAVDVGRLIEDVVAPYRMGPERGVGFSVRVPDAPLPAWADPLLLARALTNLVENAIQAMPGGGLVTVTASLDVTQVTIAVRDTGVGMDAATLERAFEPYFSTKTGGSGLGLANARINVETCGGRLEMTSQVGVGTTATVTMPRESRDGTAAGPSPDR